MVKIIDIARWMHRNIITAKQEESIVEAAKKMTEYGVGSLIIIKNKKPIGILTQTDIIKRVVASDKDLSKTIVKSVMSRKILTSPLNATIMGVSKRMRQSRVKHMLITDKGKMVGIITSTDILKIMGGG